MFDVPEYSPTNKPLTEVIKAFKRFTIWDVSIDNLRTMIQFAYELLPEEERSAQKIKRLLMDKQTLYGNIFTDKSLASDGVSNEGLLLSCLFMKRRRVVRICEVLSCNGVEDSARDFIGYAVLLIDILKKVEKDYIDKRR